MPLVLFGSGEFTDAVIPIDQYLINSYQPKKVAVIPTAAGLESDSAKWISMAQNHYTKLGLEVVPIEVYDSNYANDQTIVSRLNDCDWIFFSGGNPSYLLEVMKDSLIWQKIIDRYHQGAILMGSSAGAMIMGKYILKLPFKALVNNHESNWQESFGLINYTVLPHFNRMGPFKTLIQKILKTSPEEINKYWLGIDEDTAGIFDDQLIKVLGRGKIEIHQNKNISVVKSIVG